MSGSRLILALNQGAVAVPESGRIAVYEPPAGYDFGDLPQERTQIFQDFKPDFDTLSAQGWDVSAQPDGEHSLSIVVLPRSKEKARALIAAAVSATNGTIVIDGQKTDGVESILKAAKARGTVSGLINKAHGKLFCLDGGDFSDWPALGSVDRNGYFVAPGVFSADKPDRGSQLLAAQLPDLSLIHI